LDDSPAPPGLDDRAQSSTAAIVARVEMADAAQIQASFASTTAVRLVAAAFEALQLRHNNVALLAKAGFLSRRRLFRKFNSSM
jgi:hypothetical protein